MMQSTEMKDRFDVDGSQDEEYEEVEEDSRCQLHEMAIPAVFKDPWDTSVAVDDIPLFSYYLKFKPDPDDRTYKPFGLFLNSALPLEAQTTEIDLHLAHHRSVLTNLIPTGNTNFHKEEIMVAQLFQEMSFTVILERSELLAESVPLGRKGSSTFYLLLPVNFPHSHQELTVDWLTIRRCLSSPIFRTQTEPLETKTIASLDHLQLANGCWHAKDVQHSFVYAPHKKAFYFVNVVADGTTAHCPIKPSSPTTHREQMFKKYGIHLKHPGQPLLSVKRLGNLRNLLHNRKLKDSERESQKLHEHFIDIPPELCQLKILGFSKDIGSSLSLLPSIMHRLENKLVAIELKHVFSTSFPEGAEVTAQRVLEALTTEKCQERISMERLEILGDSFLRFAVGRHLFLLYDTFTEGELTQRRCAHLKNSNLCTLATRRNLQVYIRDQSFDPSQYFALGHPCSVICNTETEGSIHPPGKTGSEVRCSKGHHRLYKKTIAGMVGALVGAFIVDSGFKAASAFTQWIGIQVEFKAAQVIKACLASKSYLPLVSKIDVATLEDLLGYHFRHKGLLIQAFVHPSYQKHGGGCYQRLEFLGDAVLEYLFTAYILSVYPLLKPSQLLDLRTEAVTNKTFADLAVNHTLHKFIFCDSSTLSQEIKDYVDLFTLPSSVIQRPKFPKELGDVVESCWGAILVDTGFDLNCVWRLMLSFFDPVKSFSSLQLSITVSNFVAQDSMIKSKSVVEVKSELIGYDETPVDVETSILTERFN